MRRKGLVTLGLVVGLMLAGTFNSFAGQWRQDNVGWWWDEYGWYPTSQWEIINNKFYYFDADGYMLHDTIQDGVWLGSDGASVITDIGLEVAPYKSELDIMIANNLNEYNNSTGFSLEPLNYGVKINWIDCGNYYKIENVKLCHFVDSDDLDIGILSEVRIRKDCQCLCMVSYEDYNLKIITLDEWIKRSGRLPDLNIIFDDKGYIIGFKERIAG